MLFVFKSYDYGRKVKGDATITVYPTIYSDVIQPFLSNHVRKVIPIDGTATVNFDIDKELNLNDEYERRVVVDVVIEEALTGRRQNSSVEVQIHKYDYQMELIKTADYYKPGLPYVAYVSGLSFAFINRYNFFFIWKMFEVVFILIGFVD